MAGVQFLSEAGSESKRVYLDGRVVGVVRSLGGETLIWRPWFAGGTSFRISHDELLRTLRPRA